MKLHSTCPASMTSMIALNLACGEGPHVRIPYALRRVPPDCLASIGAGPTDPQPGDIVLVRVERIGRNTRLELSGGASVDAARGRSAAGGFCQPLRHRAV